MVGLDNMKKVSLSVFFPAYNEEKNIKDVIETTFSYLEKEEKISEFEVITVDDGSKDKTVEIVKNLQNKYNDLVLVQHGENKGYGSALISGFKEAKKDYVFFSDADMQFDIKEISAFLEQIPEYDLVIGYRIKRQDSLMRILNARGWNILNWILFDLNVKDIDCAFKLIRRSLLDDIQLRSQGAMISAELLIRLFNKDIKYKELPVTHFSRTEGNPTGANLTVIARAFGEIAKLYFGELGPIYQKQAMKFISVGFVNTAIDFVIYFALTRLVEFFAIYFVLAKSISFFVGTLNSLILNHYWTFDKKSSITVGEGAKFYTTTLFGLVINAVFMYLFVGILEINDLIAFGLTTILTFIWNFILSKKWVFQ